VPITVNCQACHKQFSVPDHYAGRAGKCTQCGAPMVAPTAPGLSDSAEAAFGAPGPARPGAQPGVALKAPPAMPSFGAPAAAAPTQLTVGGAFGPYKLVKKLGDAKSAVFLAEGPKGQVALKVLPDKLTKDHPSAAKRLLRESRSLFGLQHPNVPTVFDAGEELGALYLAMELFEGRSVKELLAEKKKLPPEDAVKIGLQAARAIAHFASHKLIHRNIKPEHLLIDGAGRVKLVGLGLVKGEDDGPSLTMKGHIVGTPQYLAPEVAAGERDVDFTVDLWSLGITLYELVSGDVPWNDKSALKVLQLVQSAPLPPLTAPPGLTKVIERLLARDKTARYPSPEAVVGDLEALSEGREPLAALARSTAVPAVKKAPTGTRPVAVEEPAPEVKKLTTVVIALVVVVVALVLALVYVATR
jgi:eukaryotic-like serine/threonine-protein kinase